MLAGTLTTANITGIIGTITAGSNYASIAATLLPNTTYHSSSVPTLSDLLQESRKGCKATLVWRSNIFLKI